MSSDQLLNLKQLKARGWTVALVRRFLKDPDDTQPNPMYPTAGSPMKLYGHERVKLIEASAEFADAKRKSDARKRASQKAVTTKRSKLQDQVDRMDFQLPIIERNELLDAARSDLYTLSVEASNVSDETACVNYLRHKCTKYERYLSEIGGKPGTSDAYFEIKERVLDQIAENYPWLADECHRQVERMWTEQRLRQLGHVISRLL